MSLFAELKRRNVFRVGIAYLVGAWLLLQIADVVLNNIAAPDWVFKAIMLLVGIGLPIALFFAWAFELTPDGVKRESEVDRTQSIRKKTGQNLDRSIIVILVIALAYFVWESRFEGETDTPTVTESVVQISENPVIEQAAAEEQSVAVLPFVNMSSDPEQEYFSDGITEEIINALVKIPGLSVPARTSVFGFKGHQGDVRKIGEQLGVVHVLEGSIRSQGNQVRITAQLIKVDDGFHLWSETYDRQLENIFVVQEEIATAIATVLTGELGLTIATVPNQTRNMEAYDIYLHGRALLRQREEQAIEVLEKATASDPGFAPAWAALAIAYQVAWDNEKAIQAAEMALQLDPDSVDALDAMASAFRAQLRWAEAEAFYDRALAIDPQSTELLEDYAEFLAYVGRTEEALKITTRGYALDPNLLPLAMAHAEALLSNGKLDEAVKLVDHVTAANPGHPWLWAANLPIYLARHDFSPDDEWIRRLNLPEDTLASLKAILADPTDQETIGQLKSVYSLESIEDPNLGRSIYIARDLLAWAGESDYVLDVDLATMKNNPSGIEEWGWTPSFKSVRQNPRYEQYLQKAGLIEYWDATTWPEWCQRKDDGRIECK
jgi:TolB-like protein/Flp pilus assembly protein TadD